MFAWSHLVDVCHDLADLLHSCHQLLLGVRVVLCLQLLELGVLIDDLLFDGQQHHFADGPMRECTTEKQGYDHTSGDETPNMY